MANRFGWVLTVAYLTLVARPAVADEIEQARATFRLGDEHLAASRYAEARDAYEAVLKVVDVPAVAFKAGQANEKLGKLLRAAELYTLATELKPSRFWADKQTQQRAQRDADAALQTLNTRIPTIQLAIQGDSSDALEVSVDDVKLERAAHTSPQSLDPGSHVVRLTMKDGRTLTETVALAEGDRKTVPFDVAKTTAPVKGASPPNPAAPLAAVAPAVSSPSGNITPSKPETGTRSKPSTQQWIGYASLGVGAAGLVLGTTAGLVAWSKYSDLKSQCNDSRQCDGKTYDSSNPSYETWKTVSTVGFVVAGVGAAAGITLLLVHPQEKALPSASLTVGPGILMLRGAF